MSKVLLYPEASSVLWVLVAVSELFVRAALRVSSPPADQAGTQCKKSL